MFHFHTNQTDRSKYFVYNPVIALTRRLLKGHIDRFPDRVRPSMINVGLSSTQFGVILGSTIMPSMKKSCYNFRWPILQNLVAKNWLRWQQQIVQNRRLNCYIN